VLMGSESCPAASSCDFCGATFGRLTGHLEKALSCFAQRCDLPTTALPLGRDAKPETKKSRTERRQAMHRTTDVNARAEAIFLHCIIDCL